MLRRSSLPRPDRPAALSLPALSTIKARRGAVADGATGSDIFLGSRRRYFLNSVSDQFVSWVARCEEQRDLVQRFMKMILIFPCTGWKLGGSFDDLGVRSRKGKTGQGAEAQAWCKEQREHSCGMM